MADADADAMHFVVNWTQLAGIRVQFLKKKQDSVQILTERKGESSGGALWVTCAEPKWPEACDGVSATLRSVGWWRRRRKASDPAGKKRDDPAK